MLLLAGCGGQAAPGAKTLKQEATTLQSIAAEGGILAADSARGRFTRAFARVHASELAKAAEASGAVLAKGRSAPAHALAALASRVRSDLDQLARSGSDEASQRRLAAELAHAATRAATLGKRL